MDARVSMIMVGARDIRKFRDFYERGLGWQPWGPVSGSAMYKVGQSILVFLNGDYLARERGDAVTEGSKSSLAVFVESKNQVDELFQRAIAAGGIATSAIRDRDGGLYTGYFADPEGNSWEIVWSPHMPLGSDGGLTYPL